MSRRFALNRVPGVLDGSTGRRGRMRGRRGGEFSEQFAPEDAEDLAQDVMLECLTRLREGPCPANASLPAAVYSMVRADGMSPAQVAVVLGVSAHAMRAQLRRTERARELPRQKDRTPRSTAVVPAIADR